MRDSGEHVMTFETQAPHFQREQGKYDSFMYNTVNHASVGSVNQYENKTRG